MALRAFGMERQAEARTTRKTTGSGEYDPSVIPPLVDGDGDTPGPNHKEKIGRTWLAAQLNGGDAGTVIDIRPPQEWIVGTLPNALQVPGDQILRRTDLLPAKTRRVTLVDATHEQEAFDTAKTLRDQGWTWARSLQGGWAEWVVFEKQNPVFVDSAGQHLLLFFDGRERKVVVAHDPGHRDVHRGRNHVGAIGDVTFGAVDMRKLHGLGVAIGD